MQVVEVSELTGATLDWAVAKSLGHRYARDIKYQGCGDNAFLTVDKIHVHADWDDAEEWCPSGCWTQGGPIIAEAMLEFRTATNGMWASYKGGPACWGSDHLTAGMRCFVSSKFGNEIEVPDVLVKAYILGIRT